MAAPQLPIMGDYCKRTDDGQVSRGFVRAYPANFDIKHFVLSDLRENQFDGNAIRDPWANLARFGEIVSMCKPDNVTEDQVKLRLFGFSIIGRAKDLLLCLQNGIIRTRKELEDKFLEIFFTTTQFNERRAEILNFEQQDAESLYDSWERFKLLLHRCPNHNLYNMEQIQSFIKSLKSLTRMLLDASAGGTIRQMTAPQVRDLIEKTCMNEYHTKSARSVKAETVGTPKSILTVDTHTSLLAQIEMLKKHLAASCLNKANVSQVQTHRCDFCGKGHENERCLLEGSREEVKLLIFKHLQSRMDRSSELPLEQQPKSTW